MLYIKKFDSLEEMRIFVTFHKEETGLCFEVDLDTNSAWIDVDEKSYRYLKLADCCDVSY